MADGGGNSQQFQSTAFNDYKRRMIGQKVGSDPNNKRPTLCFSMRKNLPQIDVKTGVQNDAEYGRISAKFPSIDDFEAAMKMFEHIIDGPNNTKEAVQISARKFIQGKMSDPMPDANFIAGKDENGVVWIGVTSWQKDRPIVKFLFAPDDMMRYKHGDGRPWEAGELSVLYAKGMLRRVRQMLGFAYYHEYTAPPPRDNNQSGGGGGGNNGGGGGNRNYGSDDGFPD